MAFTSDKEDKELISRVEDIADLSLTRNKPYYLGFLNEREQYIIEKTFPFYETYFSFFGGYKNAKRRFLCFSQDIVDEAEYPFSAVYFTFRKTDKLTHRDFLGALMNLGIERNCVGDIVVNEGKAVCFVKNEIKDYIQSQISKIGRVGVKISDKSLDIDYSDNIKELQLIVSSLRLDVIAAALTKLSRGKTADFILSGKVYVNYSENKNVSHTLCEGDILSVRGYGKFVIKNQIGTTKKGRIKIIINHYR